MIAKHKPVRSKALRESARNQYCTLRLPGHCNGDPETVVLSHLPFGTRGMGIKASDTHACWSCSGCHDALDGRVYLQVDTEILLEQCLRAHAETMARWVEDGLVKVKGSA